MDNNSFKPEKVKSRFGESQKESAEGSPEASNKASFDPFEKFRRHFMSAMQATKPTSYADLGMSLEDEMKKLSKSKDVKTTESDGDLKIRTEQSPQKAPLYQEYSDTKTVGLIEDPKEEIKVCKDITTEHEEPKPAPRSDEQELVVCNKLHDSVTPPRKEPRLVLDTKKEVPKKPFSNLEIKGLTNTLKVPETSEGFNRDPEDQEESIPPDFNLESKIDREVKNGNKSNAVSLNVSDDKITTNLTFQKDGLGYAKKEKYLSIDSPEATNDFGIRPVTPGWTTALDYQPERGKNATKRRLARYQAKALTNDSSNFKSSI